MSSVLTTIEQQAHNGTKILVIFAKLAIARFARWDDTEIRWPGFGKDRLRWDVISIEDCGVAPAGDALPFRFVLLDRLLIWRTPLAPHYRISSPKLRFSPFRLTDTPSLHHVEEPIIHRRLCKTPRYPRTTDAPGHHGRTGSTALVRGEGRTEDDPLYRRGRLFEVAYNEMPVTCKLSWISGNNVAAKKSPKVESKIKYTCPERHQNAWGKPWPPKSSRATCTEGAGRTCL